MSSERRLAAIMFTDIAGYSSLTQRDEELALRLLDKHNELVRPILSRFNGVEVKTVGDSFLVEFSSALDAVQCSVELQKTIGEQNAKSGEQLLVRVGIHIGDVVHRNNDVFGDAVNIASRIESIAEPGGVCLSEQVYAQVRNKVPFKFVKLQPRQLKNITFPIDVYSVQMPAEEETGSELDIHRLAVLPFANISPDPNDAYFADGLTEELISNLSMTKGLSVIARTSVMKYKGKEKGIGEIGKELDAGILVEGSVRKAGNRIRVTVQVINSNNEERLWSSTFDKNLDDIFAVQAEIAAKVSESLRAFLHSKLPVHVSLDTKNVTAYTYYLRATQLLNEGSDDSVKQAFELFSSATKLDPSFARAYVGMGNCYAQLGIRSYLALEPAVAGAKSSATKALQIEPALAEAHALLSFQAWVIDDFVTSEREARRAIQLNPNLDEVHVSLARIQLTVGYPISALKSFETAYTLDPLSGDVARYYGLLLAWTGRESEALDLWNRSTKVAPFETHASMAEYALGKQDYGRFEEEVKALESVAPSDYRTITYRAFLQAVRGAKEELAKTVAKLESTFKGGATVDRNIGYIKYLCGDLDGFFEAMFRAVEGHTLDPLRMRYSPTFEKARQDPRYREMLKRNGLESDLKESVS